MNGSFQSHQKVKGGKYFYIFVLKKLELLFNKSLTVKTSAKANIFIS